MSTDMTVTISQDANPCDLEWVAGDPVSLAFSVGSVNWSGTYTAQVRTDYGGTVVATLTATATFNTPNTDFTLALSDSSAVTSGTYVWDLQQTNGVTRLKGAVRVTRQVTA